MPGWVKLETVLVVLLAVLAVALFPAARGPFTATHGPASTVRRRFDQFVARLTAGFSRIPGLLAAAVMAQLSHWLAYVPVPFLSRPGTLRI